jgi:hypothetical protein
MDVSEKISQRDLLQEFDHRFQVRLRNSKAMGMFAPEKSSGQDRQFFHKIKPVQMEVPKGLNAE